MSYREDIVNIELMGGNIHRTFMHKTIGAGDDRANRFGVRVYRNGEPEAISGNCFGLFIRADGATVAINNGTVSGNLAYVTLPEACYAVEGVFTLAIKVSTSGDTTTLRIVDGMVSRTSTDAAVDPGTVIPSVEDLIEAIDEAVASIPADYSGLWKSIAPTFDTSKNYKADEYVNYNGATYRFKVAHPAGTWNSDHVKKIDIGKGVSEIKGALDRSGIWPVSVEHGNILTADGREADNDQRLRTGFIDVSDVDYINIILEAGYRMSILFYDADGIYVGGNNDWGDIQSATRWYDVSDRDMIRCVIINKNPPSEDWVIPFEKAQSNYVAIFKSANNFLASTGKSYIEKDTEGIYFRWDNYIWLRGSMMYNLPACADTELTLVDSPLGVENCVYIERNKTLAVDIRTLEYLICDTEDLRENSPIIPLVNVITVGDYRATVKGLLNDSLKDWEQTFIKANVIISLTYQREPYFEYEGTTGVYFNSNGTTYIRGYSNSSYIIDGRNWNGMEGIPLADGIDLVTSPTGKTDCLFIPHNQSAIYVPINNTVYLVGNDELWKYPNCLLLFQVVANKGHDAITNGIGLRDLKYANEANGIGIDSGDVFLAYNSAFKNVGTKVEPFMFFSDPHVMSRENNFNAALMSMMVNSLRMGYENTPTAFIVDGGDWLNSRDYQDVACYKLGLIDGIMRKNFPNYYPANGNHDTNYQGYVSEEDQSSGELDNDTMIALHYKQNGKMYYSFDGIITKNYVFDSGLDSDSTVMNAYRWEQVDWFARKLIEDDHPHGVVWVHIAFLDWRTFDVTQIGALMGNVGLVIAAYNARQSITLNGQTYNFSGKTGRIWAVLCGHTHHDMNSTLGGVPLVSVINALNSGTTTALDTGVVSYDLGFFDFDNEVLKLFRIGNGSNRTFNL